MLLGNCHSVWEDHVVPGQYTQCVIRLGYYANYAELGLSDPWQYQAGFIGMPGGKGVLGGNNFRLAEEGLNPGGPFPDYIYDKMEALAPSKKEQRANETEEERAERIADRKKRQEYMESDERKEAE